MRAYTFVPLFQACGLPCYFANSQQSLLFPQNFLFSLTNPKSYKQRATGQLLIHPRWQLLFPNWNMLYHISTKSLLIFYLMRFISFSNIFSCFFHHFQLVFPSKYYSTETSCPILHIMMNFDKIWPKIDAAIVPQRCRKWFWYSLLSRNTVEINLLQLSSFLYQ